MTKYFKKNFKKFYVKKKNYRWSSLAKKACLKAGLGLGLPLVPAVLPLPYSMGYQSCRKARKVPRLLPEKAYQVRKQLDVSEWAAAYRAASKKIGPAPLVALTAEEKIKEALRAKAGAREWAKKEKKKKREEEEKEKREEELLREERPEEAINKFLWNAVPHIRNEEEWGYTSDLHKIDDAFAAGLLNDQQFAENLQRLEELEKEFLSDLNGWISYGHYLPFKFNKYY